MPVHDRDEVTVPLRHRDIGDVGAPHFVHLSHLNVPKQIPLMEFVVDFQAPVR
jgi:hypothetical protein